MMGLWLVQVHSAKKEYDYCFHYFWECDKDSWSATENAVFQWKKLRIELCFFLWTNSEWCWKRDSAQIDGADYDSLTQKTTTD